MERRVSPWGRDLRQRVRVLGQRGSESWGRVREMEGESWGRGGEAGVSPGSKS